MNLIGSLYIDGIDTYLEYGVWVAQYGYAQLMQFPSFKTIQVTEWKDEDGVEPDLTDPQLDTRTIQISFNIMNKDYAEDLFVKLMDGSYHEFRFNELERTFKLRLTQNPKLSYLRDLGSVTLSFADDFPFTPESSDYPLETPVINQEGYEIDDIDLSRFGIWVLKDTDENIRKAANVKENLKVTSKNTSGTLYDGWKALYKSKDVQLKLLIHASSIKDFWRRYFGFYAALIKPEQRTLFYDELIEEYEFYYKSSQVSKFEILDTGKVWCEFTVTITFLKDIHETGEVLATEDDICIILEDTPVETSQCYILLGQNPYKSI